MHLMNPIHKREQSSHLQEPELSLPSPDWETSQCVRNHVYNACCYAIKSGTRYPWHVQLSYA